MNLKVLQNLASLGSLGASLVRSAGALFDAEVEQLRFELAQNWSRLLRLVLLAAFLFGVVFWSLGALLFAAGAGLATVLPVWAAALGVGLGLLVLASLLFWVLRVRARRLESPLRTVSRRVARHFGFWRKVLADRLARGGSANDAGSSGEQPSRDAS